jgi:asparagine synthase (glutamine-hydrolysing)
MCGIAGQFGLSNTSFAERALAALKHRGPDGHGVWQGGQTTLVHTRLAILDLSEAGTQPMVFDGGSRGSAVRPAGDSSDGHRQVLVFNGEIYNYLELRNELEAQGESFVGNSDTEVLLRLLVREGEACLPKLAGMFAFAFWDEAAGSALLARDPLGIKPLYYRQEDGALAFASETRVLRKEGDETDAQALRDFFLWGSVQEPATLNTAVRQLPAGHCLKWKNGILEIKQWHSVTRSNSKPRSPESAAVQTRDALLDSMRRHLVSDVPVGIFLSGGIDSTVILALTREVLGPDADIRTFSIGFDDPEFDESGLARRTAAHFGALHTEWRMTPEEGSAEIPAFLAAVDQPGIDGFNTWCVSKLARREGVKVVLSGLGGDEIFAGYSSFERVPQFRRAFQLLGPLRRLAAGILNRKEPATPWRRLGAFFDGGGSWLEAYHAKRGIFTADEATVLAETISGRSVPPANWMIADLPEHPREVVSRLEVTRYMRNQLLRDSDVFSMAHGLELRVPFVDARLLSQISGISTGQRLRKGKQLLLAAVPEVPEWIRNQPKRGFRFPFQQWLEEHFGGMLAEAQRVSPIPLKAWYRTWAVAAAIRGIR